MYFPESWHGIVWRTYTCLSRCCEARIWSSAKLINVNQCKGHAPQSISILCHIYVCVCVCVAHQSWSKTNGVSSQMLLAPVCCLAFCFMNYLGVTLLLAFWNYEKVLLVVQWLGPTQRGRYQDNTRCIVAILLLREILVSYSVVIHEAASASHRELVCVWSNGLGFHTIILWPAAVLLTRGS